MTGPSSGEELLTADAMADRAHARRPASYRIRSYAKPGPPRRPGYRHGLSTPAERYRPDAYLEAGDVVLVDDQAARLVALLSSPYAPGRRQFWELEAIVPTRLEAPLAPRWVGVADRVALAPTEAELAEERAEDRRSAAWGEL